MADQNRTDNPRGGGSADPSRTPAATTSAPQRSSRHGLAPRDLWSLWSGSPFGNLFRRWNEEMDRLWEGTGQGRGLLTPSQGQTAAWAPQVDVFQRGDEFVVRADLPGLSKNDVRVDVADNVLTIQGERKQEHEEEHEGWYRAERSYGSFYRAVPLPEGAIADSAKAQFKNGVLEVTLQAPPKEVSRGRRVEVAD